MRLKIEDRFPAELMVDISEAWKRQEKWLPDRIREQDDLLEYFLFNAGAQWYEVPNHRAWFYIWNLIPGLTADFYWLSDGKIVVRDDSRSALKVAMREYDLRRLTLHLPSPAEEALRSAQSLGFVQEGRLRDATFYGGEYADMVVMGFHRSQVENGNVALSPAAQGDDRSKKRKRRSRRKKVA